MKPDAAASPVSEPIYVTRPFLPPLQELQPLLESIWQTRQLSNGGPFHRQLEEALGRALGVPHVSLVNNCTIGLITALQALRLEGEVITTPYSFVATTHALMWNRLQPVFADIDPHTLNLDPARIEQAITPRTSAILAVHCYGTPCDVDAIQAIADRHGLKVIYDAAHAFGIKDRGETVLRHGDLSVLSFHATKVFNTFEGGAIVAPSAEAKARVDKLKSFGMVDENTIDEVGLNGKMSEFNAAVGLVQLQHYDEVVALRRAVDARYREALGGIPGLRFVGAQAPEGSNRNYSFFPMLVEPEYPLTRDALFFRLRENGIVARRYFAPLISTLPMYSGHPSADPGNLPVAMRAAERVICLPLYPDLTPEQQARIIDVVRDV